MDKEQKIVMHTLSADERNEGDRDPKASAAPIEKYKRQLEARKIHHGVEIPLRAAGFVSPIDFSCFPVMIIKSRS